MKNNLKNSKRSLTNLCVSRWVERHTSVMEFQTNFPEIVKSLTSISEWTDQVSSTKANSLLLSLCNCEFVITLYILSNILSITLPASKILQGVNLDVSAASNCIISIIQNLEDKRLNAEEYFSEIFLEAKTTMIDLDIEVELPRLTKIQNKRANTPASTLEEYYRRVVYIPLIDNILEDLRLRFLNKKTMAIFQLIQFIPANIIKISSLDVKNMIDTVIENFTFLYININILKGEVDLWKSKWISSKNKGI